MGFQYESWITLCDFLPGGDFETDLRPHGRTRVRTWNSPAPKPFLLLPHRVVWSRRTPLKTQGSERSTGQKGLPASQGCQTLTMLVVLMGHSQKQMIRQFIRGHKSHPEVLCRRKKISESSYQ